MWRITRPSGIIKGSPTSCCSVGSRKRVTRSRYNVARGWVGSKTITIKRRREQLEEWKSPGSTFGNGRWADASPQSAKLARLRDQMGLTNETDQIRAADRSGDRGT